MTTKELEALRELRRQVGNALMEAEHAKWLDKALSGSVRVSKRRIVVRPGAGSVQTMKNGLVTGSRAGTRPQAKYDERGWNGSVTGSTRCTFPKADKPRYSVTEIKAFNAFRELGMHDAAKQLVEIKVVKRVDRAKRR